MKCRRNFAEEKTVTNDICDQVTNEAVAASYNATTDEWREAAYNALRAHARTHAEFSAEDLWDVIPRVRERRALGGVVRRAVANKIIEPAGYMKSNRPDQHRSIKGWWKSLVFEQDGLAEVVGQGQ
jgi:hypothetical protein